MIVDAFTETLETGLESPGQVVVSVVRPTESHQFYLPLRGMFTTAYDSHFRVWMAEWS